MSPCPECQAENAADAAVCACCRAALANSQCVPERTRRQSAPPPPDTSQDDEPEPPGTVPVDNIPPAPLASNIPAGEVEAPLTGPPVAAEPLTASAEARKTVTSPQPPQTPVTDATRPRLRVIRGLKVNVEYAIYEGQNLIGRRDDRPVDIDIEDQEPADRIWSSRQHAVITCENGKLVIEDLNSLNGTFVNRQRVHPGRKRSLLVNDVVTIGTIHLKVTL